MTRDEFEKLENGDPVEFKEIARTVRGDVIRGRGFLRIDWSDGNSTAHHASNDTSDAWLMNLSRLPRPLTPNEQLLIGELEKLLSHHDAVCSGYSEDHCDEVIASARAAILKVRGG